MLTTEEYAFMKAVEDELGKRPDGKELPYRELPDDETTTALAKEGYLIRVRERLQPPVLQRMPPKKGDLVAFLVTPKWWDDAPAAP